MNRPPLPNEPCLDGGVHCWTTDFYAGPDDWEGAYAAAVCSKCGAVLSKLNPDLDSYNPDISSDDDED